MNINIRVNIFVYVCVFIYTHNKYTQYTHIYVNKKRLFWMRLIAINRLTALVCILFIISSSMIVVVSL